MFILSYRVNKGILEAQEYYAGVAVVIRVAMNLQYDVKLMAGQEETL